MFILSFSPLLFVFVYVMVLLSEFKMSGRIHRSENLFFFNSRSPLYEPNSCHFYRAYF